jgi:hypothetical protein
MVPRMHRQLRRVLVLAGVVALPAIGALPPLAACAANDGPPACNALAACCDNSPDINDPSSCLETAQSGELSDASCGAELATYVAMGQCLLDGAAASAPDGSVDHQ